MKIIEDRSSSGHEKNSPAIETIEKAATAINKKLLLLSKKLIDEWEEVKAFLSKRIF